MECHETAKYLSIQFGAGGTKWTTLEHNGVLFPPPYVPHGIPLIYDGKEVILGPDAEETATLYAKFTPDGFFQIRKRSWYLSVFFMNIWNSGIH